MGPLRGRLVRRAARYRRLLERLPDANHRVLPDYLLIGTQRGGTTAMHSYLTEHPQVQQPLRKEIHYFDRFYPLGSRWYRAHFPLGGADREWITGEATADYLFEQDAPARAERTLTDPRLVVLLREPASRAYSAWALMNRRGLDQRPFDEAVEEELRSDPVLASSLPFVRGPRAYLSRGLYHHQLRRWTEVFGRSSLLVLASEELRSEPARVYRRVLGFLGLERFEAVEFRPKHATDTPPLSAPVRRALESYYEPANQQLFSWLDEELPW